MRRQQVSNECSLDVQFGASFGSVASPPKSTTLMLATERERFRQISLNRDKIRCYFRKS